MHDSYKNMFNIGIFQNGIPCFRYNRYLEVLSLKKCIVSYYCFRPNKIMKYNSKIARPTPVAQLLKQNARDEFFLAIV